MKQHSGIGTRLRLALAGIIGLAMVAGCGLAVIRADLAQPSSAANLEACARAGAPSNLTTARPPQVTAPLEQETTPVRRTRRRRPPLQSSQVRVTQPVSLTWTIPTVADAAPYRAGFRHLFSPRPPPAV